MALYLRNRTQAPKGKRTPCPPSPHLPLGHALLPGTKAVVCPPDPGKPGGGGYSSFSGIGEEQTKEKEEPRACCPGLFAWEAMAQGTNAHTNTKTCSTAGPLCIIHRSYWIPGSWNLRMVYTGDIPFYDP